MNFDESIAIEVLDICIEYEISAPRFSNILVNVIAHLFPDDFDEEDLRIFLGMTNKLCLRILDERRNVSKEKSCRKKRNGYKKPLKNQDH